MERSKSLRRTRTCLSGAYGHDNAAAKCIRLARGCSNRLAFAIGHAVEGHSACSVLRILRCHRIASLSWLCVRLGTAGFREPAKRKRHVQEGGDGQVSAAACVLRGCSRW